MELIDCSNVITGHILGVKTMRGKAYPGTEGQTPNPRDLLAKTESLVRAGIFTKLKPLKAEELSQSAPVSEKIASLCQYRCQECHEILGSWNTLHNHCVKQHQKKISFNNLIPNIYQTDLYQYTKLFLLFPFLQRFLIGHALIRILEAIASDTTAGLPWSGKGVK